MAPSCAERVFGPGEFRGHSCGRKAVADDGTKCKQHSAAATQARDQQRRERWATQDRARNLVSARLKARDALVDKVAQLLEESVQPGGGVMVSSKWRQELQALVERARQ